MDAYIGEIRLLPYTFAPDNWLPCDGRTLAINSYQTLYAVIGITYGGDGKTNFKLPNLSSSIALHHNGALPDTVLVGLGKTVGAANVALTAVPSHNHAMNGKNTTTLANRLTKPATDAQPAQVLFDGATSTAKAQKAFSAADAPQEYFTPTAVGAFGATTVAGHSNQQPYLPLNFMIMADGGTFPTPG
jgi:microcystin-dependent protein